MDLLSRPFSFVVVFVLGAILDWGIPVVIYWRKFGLFKKRPRGFVGCNSWGVVMDVFLAGGINLAVFDYLLSMKRLIGPEEILAALLLGLFGMMAIHVWMALTFWREWIMPTPWRWNVGGYYHMFSMAVQFSFAFLPLVLFWERPELLRLSSTRLLVLMVLVGGILFLLALSVKDKTVRIGPIMVGGKSW